MIALNIKKFIRDLLVVSNAYDTDGYLNNYHKNAILDDPSVGKVFKGHAGIRKYFEDYFVGYKTQTRLIRLDSIDDHSVHIEVEFTGEFPEGKIRGTFDFTFKDGKILSAKADLL